MHLNCSVTSKCTFVNKDDITPLYSLESFHPNSLFSESITSYIARIAQAHCLTTGDLLARFFAPRMGKKYLEKSAHYGGSRFYESSASILGNGQEAADWVRELNLCTGHNDLHQLTMLAWRKQIPSRNLIKPYRSWCPQCLNEMLPLQIYEPLIWTIMPVRVCLIHKLPLETICPNCSKSNYHINRRHCNGFCNRCGAWLGCKYRKHNNSEISFSQQWVDNFTFLFNYSSAHKSDEADLNHHLGELMNIISNGSLSTLSRILKKPKSTVWGWLKGNSRPSLTEQLAICQLFNITLEQLYFGPIQPTPPHQNPRSQSYSSTKVHRFNKDEEYHEVYQQFRKYINGEIEPQSLRNVSKKLGISIPTLRKYFPELCSALKQINDEASSNSSTVEALYRALVEAEIELQSEGRYSSRRSLEAMLGKPVFLNRKIRDRWKSREKNE